MTQASDSNDDRITSDDMRAAGRTRPCCAFTNAKPGGRMLRVCMRRALCSVLAILAACFGDPPGLPTDTSSSSGSSSTMAVGSNDPGETTGADAETLASADGSGGGTVGSTTVDGSSGSSGTDGLDSSGASTTGGAVGLECHPLEQNCSVGHACIAVDSSFECVPAGTVPFGGACEQQADCEPNLYCAEATDVDDCMNDACCTPYCDAIEGMMMTVCDQPTAGCVSLFDPGMAPPGYEDVGYCDAV